MLHLYDFELQGKGMKESYRCSSVSILAREHDEFATQLPDFVIVEICCPSFSTLHITISICFEMYLKERKKT